MKKYLVLLPLLLAAAVGTLAAGHCWLNSARDQVEITEYTLKGDPEAAGVALTYRAEDQNRHLFWETTFSPGYADEAETAFEFSDTSRSYPGRVSWYSNVGVYTFASSGMGMSGIFPQDMREEDDPTTPVRAVLDVAGRTPDGEERTEIVRLADYYEYYPIVLDIYSQHKFDHINTFENGWLREYFRLKVPEEKQMEITLQKDSGGNIVDVWANNQDEDDWDDLYYDGVVTDNGIYLIAYSCTNEGPDDRLQCPDGPGVHFIPAIDPEQDNLDGWWDYSKIQLLYPTGDAVPLYLSAGPDETKLLLYTQEGEKLFLTILDANTGEVLQKLELMEYDADFGLTRLEQDNLIYIRQDGEFCLVAEEGGYYEIVLTGMPDPDFVLYDTELTKVAWDGKRMAVVTASSYCSFYHSMDHSIRLGVWDADGLLYLGAYDYGISRDPYARIHLLEYSSSPDTFSIAFSGS